MIVRLFLELLAAGYLNQGNIDWVPTTVVTDRTFSSAEPLLCRSARMTELFSAEHRTFFTLHSMPMPSFHIFVLLNDPHVP